MYVELLIYNEEKELSSKKCFIANEYRYGKYCILGRQHATISREIKQNATHRYNEYEAEEKAYPKE
ncbi:MAG: hypothetical protein Kow00102_10200 [Spirochaetota bacterium]